MGDKIGSLAARSRVLMRVRMRRLFCDGSGVTAVEFALVAPAFMMFIFLIIDGARMTWSYQALQEVATSSARCAALDATGCKTSSEVKDYAVARAAASGIKLTTDAVTLSSAATCYSVAGMTKVVIASAYQGATTKLLPSALSMLNIESCFPTSGAGAGAAAPEEEEEDHNEEDDDDKKGHGSDDDDDDGKKDEDEDGEGKGKGKGDDDDDKKDKGKGKDDD